MSPKLHELLNQISSFLHFMGKYQECKNLNALSAFLIKHNVYYADQLEDWNFPAIVDMVDRNSELLDLIEQAAESDESECRSIICGYYEKNIRIPDPENTNKG